MNRLAYAFLGFALTLLSPVWAETGATPAPWSQRSLSELEARLAALDAELKQLASYSLNGSVGSIGYQSKPVRPEQQVTIRIELEEERLIDQVVITPTLRRHTQVGPRADGFPVKFRVLTGTAHTRKLQSSFSESDHLLPRIAPLVIPFSPVKASWVEIIVDETSAVEYLQQHMLKFSEIMVFSGLENVALQKKITSTSPAPYSLAEKYLVDGITPYLMDAAQGKLSQAMQLRTPRGEMPPTLTIDLKAFYPLSQINLHAIDQSRTIPASYLNDFGIPQHLRITGSRMPDFSDEMLLFELKQQNKRDLGPILIRNFPKTTCRFVRITVVEASSLFANSLHTSQLGFDEIEILSAGENVARGCAVTAHPARPSEYDQTALHRMTDGHNYFGQVLPLRRWVNELARRHDLETLRPQLIAEINQRYARQQIIIRVLIWSVVLLLVAAATVFLIEYRLHLQELKRLRKRIAADLHDELGANFHTISLLSQLLEKKVAPLSGEAARILERIRDTTRRSGISVRHISRIQDSKELSSSVEADMRRAAERIVAELKHEVSIEGQEWLARLRPQARIDLLLFYKECLVNICRHSGASELSTHLVATKREIQLTITDNGIGLDGSVAEIPTSLTRRAELMGAQLHVENRETHGTRIILTYRPRRRWWAITQT